MYFFWRGTGGFCKSLTRTEPVCVCDYVHISVCIYVCVCVFFSICVCVFVCIYVCLFLCPYMCQYLCLCLHLCMCLCLFLWLCLLTYQCSHCPPASTLLLPAQTRAGPGGAGWGACTALVLVVICT